MKLKFALFIFVSLMIGPLMATNAAQIYGYVEKVSFPDKKLSLSAKLDTGAKSASLHAVNIKKINVHGVPYLRFTVPTKTGDYTFECEYKGRVKIKTRADENGEAVLNDIHVKRPVVFLNLQLGNQTQTIKVNLTNRKRFLYPLLLGRDAIIAFNGVIDPARTFTLKVQSTKENEK